MNTMNPNPADNKSPTVNNATAELVVIDDQKLDVVIKSANLSADAAQGLLSEFSPLFAKAKELCATAKNIVVTDATQVTEIKQARTLRIAIRAVRIESEKKRKALKEDSLRRGKAIDGVHNVLEYAIAPVEERLLAMEEFAERAEAARKASVKAAREEALRPYVTSTEFYSLGDMTEEAFEALLAGSKAAVEAKIAAEKKAAEEKAAREKAEAEERERIRAENERLKKEREQLEAAAKAAAAKAKAERDAAEAKAAQEREAAAKALAEQKRIADLAAAEARKREAEERAKIEAERQAAERAAKAPDKDKLLALASAVRALDVPAFATDSAKSLAKTIESQREKFAVWIEEKAAGL